MRHSEKLQHLNNKIEQLEKRIEELEKIHKTQSIIGFEVDTSDSMEYEAGWDDTPSVTPTHWESDNN